MKKLVALLFALMIFVAPLATVPTAEAWPVQCADGFAGGDCLIALIQEWILGGPWDGTWDIGGHNWDW